MLLPKQHTQNDLLRLMLVRTGKYNLLPELHDIVGDELFLDILEAFAGATLQLPSIDELKTISKEVSIYVRIKPLEQGKRWKMCEEIGADYYQEAQTIWAKYEEMVSLIEGKMRVSI